MEDTSLIIHLIKGSKITERMICDELYEICDREHSSCNYDCPVYALNGYAVPHNNNDTRYGCDCFKNGKAMLDFIKSH